MKHLLEATRALEVRRAALELQSEVIDLSDGRVSVELQPISEQHARLLEGDGIVMTFTSDVTKSKALAVVGIDGETGHLAVWLLWAAGMLTAVEMLSRSQHIVKFLPREHHQAVDYILKSCFAVDVGRIDARTYNELRNRRLLINDDGRLLMLKHIVPDKRLAIGEYGAFTDLKFGLKMGKHVPHRLYRYQVEAVTTSSGAEFPSVEAMMKRYRASQMHELWAGVKLKVRGLDLGWGAGAFFSHDGHPLRFFTLTEV